MPEYSAITFRATALTNAPRQTKYPLGDHYVRYSDQAGRTKQENVENSDTANAARCGTITRRYANGRSALQATQMPVKLSRINEIWNA